MGFKDTTGERDNVSELMEKIDILFKQGYNHIMQPWQITLKKYREIWYRYEETIAGNPNLKIENNKTKSILP